MTVDYKIPVLVVDDYEPKVRVTCNLLKEIGFPNVYEATDGATAFALMHHCKFGLVITNGEMAPVSGYELLDQVRHDAGLKNTPFIVMSKSGAETAPADGCIAQPINITQLKKKVQAVLNPRD